MSDYYSNFAGSSTANFVFVVILLVVNCIRKRLNKSKCQSHCYIFDCEAHLDDLKHVKHEVQTQRGMLQSVLELLDSKSLGPIFLQPAGAPEEQKMRDPEAGTD